MKKKNVNKLLALGLVSAMTAGMLAGCGNTASTTTDNGAADTTVTEATDDKTSTDTAKADNGEVPTLIWWSIGGTPPDDFDKTIAEISDYTEEKIGVRLDVKIASWADWGTKMNNIVNTGEYFDLMFVNNTNYSKFVNLNALADITDLVQSETPELYDFIPEDLWRGATIKEKVYAVPTYKDSSQSEYVVWDKAKIEAAGYDYTKELGITDLDELTAPLKAIKDTDGEASFPLNKNGGGYQSYMYDQLGAGLYPLGVRYDDSEGKVVATVEQDDVKQILKTFHEWYNEGIINSDAATRPEDANYKACSIAQGWSGAAITSWGPQLGVECVAQKWGPTIVSNETVRGSLNCISANCANPEKALQFLQLVNTDTYVRDLFYYGVQGDNWDYTDDSKTFVHKNNADWSMAGYTQGSFFAITPTDDFDFNQFDEVKELNEKAEPSVLLGFTLDTTPIADELANCIQIAERYKGELLTGTADPEVMVPQMMQELRAAGFDKIVAEAQSQVDAFMATNK